MVHHAGGGAAAGNIVCKDCEISTGIPVHTPIQQAG